ncbi:MAG: oligopeptide/dipeptide ABC transporter ATP-binding protein [Rhizobacter sp.]
MTAPVVEAVDLSKQFALPDAWWRRVLGRPPRRALQAVADVSFSIERGRTFGLVGESGSGKTTVGRLMVGLHAPSGGEVRIGGQPFGPALRRQVQMVFQDPYASLNPRWTVREIVGEPLREQQHDMGRAERQARVGGLLAAVGLSADDGARFPHQFSGGQRQRISIARALATDPSFLVCDEPTSALDVSVQAQVLNLMKDLQRERGVAYLFISHNLAVVRHVSDEVGVMYAGRLVERSPAEALFARPRHPYTRLLLDAVPGRRRDGGPDVPPSGEMPDPFAPPAGCAFHPRCPLANDRCRVERPLLRPAADGVQVACHAVAEGRD